MLECGVWLGFESGKSWWLQILATKLTLSIHLRHIFVYGIFIRREAKMGKTSKSTHHTNIKHIIIQAGGKGTRLEGLTRNKPKCLVPICNKPMIFHLFNKYQDSKFVIIGDYKYEVLEKYLTTFAKNIDYQMVKSVGNGNICGIKKSLELIPDNEVFMLIWSDLLLSSDFNPPPHTITDNDSVYVGILENQTCSWSLISGALDKVQSNECGVAGCFIFANKSQCADIAECGSFTAWLKESGLNFIPMKMPNCKEIGTIKALKALDDAQNRCRPYNHIEFRDDKVIKTTLTQEGQNLIIREISWYDKLTQYGFKAIPKIYSHNPLTMQKINGDNIFQAKLTQKQKLSTIHNLIKQLTKMHSYETKSADKEDLIKEYFTKTMDRLDSIKYAIPFSQSNAIKINNKICKNPLKFRQIFKNAVETMLLDTIFCPIHGDCTLTNTMIDKGGNIYFIDARGYFGKQEVFGDIRYDWAKLYFSLCGNFDNFNIKKFDLNVSNDSVTFAIESNGWEYLANEILGTVCNLNEIQFIHAIIWLSLASHCWEDYDSMCLAFYNGVYLINDFIGETE